MRKLLLICVLLRSMAFSSVAPRIFAALRPDHWAPRGGDRTGHCARRRICATVSQAREVMKAYHPHQTADPCPKTAGIVVQAACRSWRFAGRRSFTRVLTLRYEAPHIYTSSKYGTRSAVWR
jgi:hypothetical protein